MNSFTLLSSKVKFRKCPSYFSGFFITLEWHLWVIHARVVSVRLVFLRSHASARTAAMTTSSVASTTASTMSISMILRQFTVHVSFTFDFEKSGDSAFFTYVIFRYVAVFAHMTRGVAPPAFTLKLRTLGLTTWLVAFILILGFCTFHILDVTFGFTFRFTAYQHHCTLLVILANDFCHFDQAQIFLVIHLTFQILVLGVGQHPIPDLIIALSPIVTVLDQNF